MKKKVSFLACFFDQTNSSVKETGREPNQETHNRQLNPAFNTHLE